MAWEFPFVRFWLGLVVWYSNRLKYSLRLRWERRKCSALVTCECPWLHPALFTGKIRFIPLLVSAAIFGPKKKKEFGAAKKKYIWILSHADAHRRSILGSNIILSSVKEARIILRSPLFFWRSQAADSMAAFNIVRLKMAW